MRVTIDRVGRVVIPKSAREELGITGPTELELAAGDGRIELSVSEVPASVEERDGVPVIVPDAPMAPMTVEEVRDAIDRVRR